MNLKAFIDRAPDSIKKSFVYRKHGKHSSIIFPNEKNNYLYILISGNADVIIQNSNGMVSSLYNYSAYSCFGELELFNENTKTFDVVCLTNCETISVRKDFVFQWMQYDFEFTKYIIEQLTEKLLKNSQALTNLSLLNTKDRLLSCIYAHSFIGDLSRITKAEVCSETFIPLRSLNRSIAECKADGYFEYRKKSFCILSMEKLESYCKLLI